MNRKETLKFIEQWNTANNFSNEIVDEPNMRYVENGVVAWNIYDSPNINIEQVINIYKTVKSHANKKTNHS